MVFRKHAAMLCYTIGVSLSNNLSVAIFCSDDLSRPPRNSLREIASHRSLDAIDQGFV